MTTTHDRRLANLEAAAAGRVEPLGVLVIPPDLHGPERDAWLSACRAQPVGNGQGVIIIPAKGLH